jgi:hypothetical protein
MTIVRRGVTFSILKKALARNSAPLFKPDRFEPIMNDNSVPQTSSVSTSKHTSIPW